MADIGILDLGVWGPLLLMRTIQAQPSMSNPVSPFYKIKRLSFVSVDVNASIFHGRFLEIWFCFQEESCLFVSCFFFFKGLEFCISYDLLTWLVIIAKTVCSFKNFGSEWDDWRFR